MTGRSNLLPSFFATSIVVSLFLFSFVNPVYACDGPVGKNVGQCAPNFTIKSIDGKTFELEKLRGKVVLVNFWATWCKPCIVEMPSMQKMYNLTGRNNVEILAISIDTNESEINQFLDNKLQDHLKFPVFFDQGKKVSGMFGTFQVPETYIIDKTGRITDKLLGIREWDESIVLNYLKLLSESRSKN